MAYDGSLKFDSRINTDGFEDGASTIKRAAEACAKSAEKAGSRVNEAFNKSTQISSLENQIRQTEQKIQDMSASLEHMEDAKVPTDEYQHLSGLVEKTQLKLDGLLDRQQKMEDQGLSKNSSRWKSLQYDIEATTQKLNVYKADLQDTIDRDRAFTAGQDSSGYAKKTEALENLNNKLYVQKQRLADLIGKESEAAQEAGRLRAIADNAEVSNQKIVDLNRQLQELQARQKELKAAGVGSGYTEYDSNSAKIRQATEALKAYQAEVESMPVPESKETVGFVQSIKMAFQSLGEIAAQSGGKMAVACALARGGTKTLSAGMKAAHTAGKKLLGTTVKLAGLGLRGLSTMAQKAAGSLLKLGKAILFGDRKTKSFNRGMGSMVKKMLLFSVIRKMLNGITSSFMEGIQNYAQYSNSFNSIMSSFVSSLSQLKNSIGSAFSPITSVIIPVLDALIQKLIQVINVIGQFLAALTGKGTFSRAIKTNTDYAKSVGAAGGAAKKAGQDAKKALAPFDDLVQIQQQSEDSSGGGGGGAAGGAQFEEVPVDSGISDFASKILDAFRAGDWEGIGRIIGEKINEGVSKIKDFISWENCGAQITSFINTFTAMFNSLVATINWYEIGQMFGAGIDTLAHTLYLLLIGIDWLLLGTSLGECINGLVDIVDWEIFGRTFGAYFAAKINLLLGVVKEIEWSNIGHAITDALTGLVDQIPWANIGLLFSTGLNGAFEALGTFASTYDWVKLGSSLALSLSTFFQNFDWANAGTAISDLVIGLLEALTTFVTQTDWYAFGKGVSEGIQAVDWNGIVTGVFTFIGACFGGFAAFLGGLLADGATAAKEYFQGKIEECGGNVVAGIFKGIIDAVFGIGIWIYDNIFKPFIKGFKDAFGIHSPSKEMAEMGKYLWDGFCNGIKEFFSKPAAFIKENITDPFISKFKSLLGIHSPSTETSKIGGYTVEGFNQGIEKKQSNTKTVVQGWATGIAGWFSTKLGITGNSSAESQKWATSTISGYNTAVSGNYTQSQSKMETWAESIRKWFVGEGEGRGVNEASWKKFANQIVLAFNTEIQARFSESQAPMETWAESIRRWFVGESESQGVNEMSWKKYAETIISAFKTGIEASYTESRSPMEAWAKSVKEWFWGDSNSKGSGGLYQEFYDMAKRINEGFAQGISDFAHLAKRAIRKWADELISEAKDELDIHSPSRKSYSLGEYFVKGFNNAIADMANSSQRVVENWMDAVADALDAVNLQLPIGIDIPNAASYLPKIATGSVVPLRAGENSALQISSGQASQLSSLLEKVDYLLDNAERNKGTNGAAQIVLKLTGALAPLARALKPELDKEAARKGVKLIVVEGS